MKLNTILLEVLKTKAVWIFPTGIVYSYLDQKITQNMFELMSSMEGIDYRIWIYAACAIILGLTYPVLLVNFLVSSLEPKKNAFSFALKEQMRATGSSLLWGLALIIPGFIRYFQLLFVPMIALAHPRYSVGEIDSLKTSREMVQSHWKKLLGLTVVFALVLPLILSSFDEHKMFSRSLFTAVPLSMLETLLSLIFISFLWKIFKQECTQ